MIFSGMPPNTNEPSTMSLVVPGISVTIAFSSSSNEFRRLLFPTFGFPIIPTLIPSFMILLSSDFWIMSSSFSLNFFTLGRILLFVNTSISSYSG